MSLVLDSKILGLMPELVAGSTLPLAKMYLEKVEGGITPENMAKTTGSIGRNLRNGSMDLVLNEDSTLVLGYGNNEPFQVTDNNTLKYTAGIASFEFDLTDSLILRSWFTNLDTTVPAEDNTLSRDEDGNLSILIETRALVSNNLALSEYSDLVTNVIDGNGFTKSKSMNGETITFDTELENGLLKKTTVTELVKTDSGEVMDVTDYEYDWYIKDGKVACFSYLKEDNSYLYVMGNLVYTDLLEIDFGFKVDIQFGANCDPVLRAQCNGHLRKLAEEASATDENYALPVS